MNLHYFLLSTPLLLGALLLMAITWTAWRHRASRAVRYMAILNALWAIYMLGYALELGQTTVRGITFWAKVESFGWIPSFPVALMLVLTYTGNDRNFGRFRQLLLAAIPLLSIALTLTNEHHELIWSQMTTARIGTITASDFVPGPWYWVTIGYSYLLVLVAVALLVRAYRNSPILYRQQILLILVGFLIPILAALVYLVVLATGLARVMISYQAFALIPTGLFISWGVLNLRLLDILPIAREAIFDSMKDGIIVLDHHARIVDINPAGETIFDTKRSRIMGAPFETLIAKSTTLSTDSLTRPVESRTEMPIGDRVFDTKVSPLHHRGNRNVGALVVLRDITQRVTTIAALRRSEQDKSALLNSMSELVIYQNTQMEVVWVNKAVADLTGIPAQRLVSQRCHELLMNKTEVCTSCPVAKVLETGEHQHAELEGFDGRTWFVQGHPLRDANGNIDGVVEVVQDITDRLQTERQRFELSMQQETAKVLKRLIDDVSHDLRTPLSTIKTQIYLLNQVTDQAARERHLNNLEAQVNQLEHLVESTLNLSRLGATVQFQIEALDMNRLVKSVLDQQQPLARQKWQHVEFAPAPLLPPVQADEGYLGRAITNIVVNALQHSPEAGTVSVKTYHQQRFVVIAVTDSGQGIADDDLPHIFEPFYRADKARSTQPGVSGLGLALAKRIIDIHQGQIEVDTTPGRGSTFKIILPAAG